MAATVKSKYLKILKKMTVHGLGYLRDGCPKLVKALEMPFWLHSVEPVWFGQIIYKREVLKSKTNEFRKFSN